MSTRKPATLFSLLALPVMGLSLFACGGDIPPLTGETEILGIGDSMLAMHSGEGKDITAVVAEQLGMTAELAAVGGETLLGDEANSIPRQYDFARDGQSSLLVVTGGGNDLGACTCGVDCDPVLDALIQQDTTRGAVVDLVERAIADGRKVAWVGYMRPTEDAAAFSTCGGELEIMTARMTTLDDRLEEMVFINGLTFDTAARPELFVDDGYHPSVEGSAVLGEAVAQRVQETFSF